MEEPLLENLLIRQRIVDILKEELSISSSQVITSKSLHLPILILFSIDNVYRKLVFRDILDKRSNGDFGNIQSNGELLHLNYSLGYRGSMVKNIAALNSFQRNSFIEC